MILKRWDELPDFLRCDEVKPYYDILKRMQTRLEPPIQSEMIAESQELVRK